jgi:hypothetical protein
MENAQQDNHSLNDDVAMSGQQDVVAETGALPQERKLRSLAEYKEEMAKLEQKNSKGVKPKAYKRTESQ